MAFREKNGRWRIRIRTKGRKAKSKTLPAGTSREQVAELESKVRLGLIDPSLRSNASPLFREFANDWVERVCPVRHVPSYVTKCRQVIRTHLNVEFGDSRLDEITAKEITEFRRRLSKESYAAQSIKNITAVLSMIFREAIHEGHAKVNPAAGLERLRREQKEMSVWSPEERDRFLGYVRQHDYDVFLVAVFALFTGSRPMEIRGMLRDAVDFDGCIVSVHRQWCSKQNKLVPYTKGKTARRVPVPPEIMRIFADKRALASEDQLFPQVTNSYGHVHLKPAMKAAGVKVIRFHDLRHTFASILYDRTKNLLLVRDLLGHKSIATTQTYVHRLTMLHRDATACLMEGASFLNEPAKVVLIARPIS